MKAWTDYPFPDFPDRDINCPVEVLAYDFNKYATVALPHVQSIKTGYLFKDPSMKKMFSKFDWYSLPSSLEATRPTRRQVFSKLKNLRSQPSYYILYIKGEVNYRKIFSMKDVLKKFKGLECDAWVTKCVVKKNYVESIPLIGREDGNLIIYADRKGRSTIKHSHLNFFGIY